MPVLKNARHDAFAQNLARGMSQDAAYSKAGYTPSRHSASKLAKKPAIRARIAEIVGAAAKVATEAVARPTVIAAINFREEMQILREIVAEARAKGDVKTAGENQRFILACGGYADSPTLTHEHMAGQVLKRVEPQDDGEPAKAPDHAQQPVRFDKTLAKMRQLLAGTKH